MQQASGMGEASGKSMVHAISVLSVGTKHTGTLDPTYTFWKAQKENPALLNPIMAKNNDNWRVKCQSYKHINDWTDMVKKELIRIDMVIDKLGMISKLKLL